MIMFRFEWFGTQHEICLPAESKTVSQSQTGELNSTLFQNTRAKGLWSLQLPELGNTRVVLAPFSNRFPG